MAINPTADLIMFGIQSALKLSGALQQAYANSLRAKEIVLPLPKFSGSDTVDAAKAFFKAGGEGHHFLEAYPDLNALHEKGTRRDREEENEYIGFYRELKRLADLEKEGLAGDETSPLSGMGSAFWSTMFRVRQWERGRSPQLSPLQLIAGTVIEVGVDYFSRSPAPFFKDTPFGQSLAAFLSGFDDLSLTSKEDIEKLSGEVVPRLFISASSVLEEISDDITSDEKFQELLRYAGATVADDLFQRLKQIRETPDAELTFDKEAVLHWGRFLFRSLVRHSGDQFLGNLSDWTALNQGASKLIESTGRVLFNAILDNPVEQIDLKQAFTNETLDGVIEASFRVFAEHPELISGKQGLREIVTGVSRSVSKALENQEQPVVVPALIPELIRLVLEHTAGKLDLLWEAEEENGEHLLLITVQEFLLVISQPSAEGRWRPHFTKKQLVGLADNLVAEVAENPGWILAKVEGNSLLQEVLDSVFRALRELDEKQRLSIETVELLVEVSLHAAAVNEQVLQKLHFGKAGAAGDEDRKTILNHALNIIFAYTFDREEVPPVRRIEMLTDLVDYVLAFLITHHHPDQKVLVLLHLVLFEEDRVDFTNGFNRELADQILESGFQVLNAHPDLLTDQRAVQALIRDVAGSLKDNGFRQPGLLLEVLRLVMESTARNVALILPGADPDQPRYLLVEALQHLLHLLSQRDDEEHWQPQLTGADLIDIAEELLDTVVHHPEWISSEADDGKGVFQEVLEAAGEALRNIPEGQRLTPETLRLLLLLLSRLLVLRQDFGDPKWRELLAGLVEKVIQVLFSRAQKQENWESWAIDVLEYLLELVNSRHPDAKGLLLVHLVVSETGIFAEGGGFDRLAADRLVEAALTVVHRQPELITEKPLLRELLRGVAAILKKHDRLDLLAALLPLIVQIAGRAWQERLDQNGENALDLLLEALDVLLGELLETTPGNGADHWRLHFRSGQLLELLDDLLTFVVQEQPPWVSTGNTLKKVVRAVTHSFEAAPSDASVSFPLLLGTLRSTIAAAWLRREWTEREIAGQTALGFALEQLVGKLYREEQGKAAGWTLTKEENFLPVLEAFLEGIAMKGIQQTTVESAKEKVDSTLAQANTLRTIDVAELVKALLVEVQS